MPQAPSRFACLVAGAAWLALVSGCDKDKKDPAGGAVPSTSSLAQGLGMDAEALAPEPSDPIAPAGNLREEADHFTTLEACVAQRASKLDPLIGDAVRAIGYDTLFYDGCRTVHAAKERDPRECEPIVSSALRARCETLAAIARGDVESCPRVHEGTVAQGRSPTCLAAASGDARLCQGEPKIPRIHCEALVLRDEHRCTWLPDDALQPGMGKRSCLRELQRLRALLPEAKTGLPPLPTPKATLVLRPVEQGKLRGQDPDAGGSALAPGGLVAERTVDATAEILQGVVVFPGYARHEILDRTRLAVELGVLMEVAPGFLASSPHRGPRLGLLVSFAHGGKDARVERAELELPSSRTRVYPSERMKSTVTITRVDEQRGGELSLTFTGELDGVGMKLVATTFVRDVVTTVPAVMPAPLLAATPPPEYDAGHLGSPWLTERDR